MKGISCLLLLWLFCALPAVTGCGEKTVTSSEAVIKISEAMKTVEEKVAYLIKQAEMMQKSEKYQEVINIAQHVLTYLDKESGKAKELLEAAKKSLAEAAKAGIEEAKKGLEEVAK